MRCDLSYLGEEHSRQRTAWAKALGFDQELEKTTVVFSKNNEIMCQKRLKTQAGTKQ